MSIFTRGFTGRRRDDPDLPPGQYLAEDFPVLSAGPTPNVDKADWEFTITNESGTVYRWNWDEFIALGPDEVTTPTSTASPGGRSSARAGAGSRSTSCSPASRPRYEFTMAHSYGGYTTNVPLEDLLDGKAWVAFEFDGEDLDPEHGGPARLLVPHLYFWKSREVGERSHDDGARRARLLGAERLPPARRPVAGRAVLVTVVGDWTVGDRGRVRRGVADTGRSIVLDVPAWPGNLAGQHLDVRLTAPDGYQASRSYSIASSGPEMRVQLGVDRLPDGEVQPVPRR